MSSINSALDVKGSLNGSISPVILYKNAAGWLVPSLAAANAATYTQTANTITVTSTGHNITAVQNGKSVYLVIGSGLATTGWFSNFTYVDANTFTCTSTISQSTSGAVNTNTSITTINATDYILRGNSIGKNGAFEVRTLASMFGSTNAKTITSVFGGSNINILAHAGSVVSSANRRMITNRNDESKQVSYNINLYDNVGGSTSALSYFTINTTIDQTITQKLTVATASEFVALEHVMIMLYPDS